MCRRDFDKKTSNKAAGFTLTELLVAIAIVAVVSAIALPLYTQYSERAYRAEAQSDLMNCAQALERFNAINFTYAGTADTDNDGAGDADAGPIAEEICDPLSVEQNRYTITIAAGVNYTLTADPVDPGPMDEDGAMTLDDAGNRQWDENNDNDYADANEDDWAEDL